MTEARKIGELVLRGEITETGLPQPSTDDLDLASLPERLDDMTLARVRAIASSPLPAPVSCEPTHFAQCFRVMAAMLPKRVSDGLDGEIMFNAYRRMLGQHQAEAISYLTEQALVRCRWFPTVAECLEILGGWVRCDEAAKRRRRAALLAARERNVRWLEQGQPRGDRPPPLTQADVDAMSPELVRIGLKCGALVRDGDGRVAPAEGGE